MAAYDVPMADEVRWLTLVDKVPAEPARIGAMVWRQLRSPGAVCLQDDIAGLPVSPGAERALRGLQP